MDDYRPALPSGDGDATSTAEAVHAESSLQIGPYRLLHRIGHGGMGEVWLAEQLRPVHRQVALKVIKPGMDSAHVIARFEAERQALALMSHPGIAQVFDAGVTAQGRPFFAMEFVRGEAITTYCDRLRLSTRERIDLFLEVCEGVQHAHQKGIIHRDLKPSNILVTIRDDRPVPKIIDFGVAKAMTQPLTERTLYTELGVLIGTPEYMSPEQADLTGLDIDTRTDVYALGVLLYELLTGALPFDRIGLREKGVDEIRRVIRDTDPPRPSTRIASLGDTALATARQRGTDPVRLASQVRGDLDWITLKALEKDRVRRYGTVSDLAADLRRHLDHLPVVASPPTTAYRVGKFVRRHRWGVATCVVAVTVLAAFAVTMAIQARRIATQRARAERRLQDVRRLAGSFLFEFHDAIRDLPGAIPAREMVVKRALEYLDRLSADGEADLDTRRDIAAAYYRVADVQGHPFTPSLGDQKGALVSYRKSLELREALLRELPGNDDLRDSVGSTHERIASLLMRLGDTAGAVTHYQAAQAIWNELAAAEPGNLKRQRQLTVAHGMLGDLLDRTGNARGARDEFLEMRRNSERLLAAQPDNALFRRDLGFSFQKLGDVRLMTMGDAGGALDEYRQMIGIRESLAASEPANGNYQRDLVLSYDRIGAALVKQQKFAEAIEYFDRMSTIATRLLTADPHNAQAKRDVMVSKMETADVYRLTGRLVDAMNSLRDSRLIIEDLLSTNPQSSLFRSDLAEALAKTAEVLVAQRSVPSAIEHYQRGRSILEELSTADPQNTQTLETLAEIDQRLAEASEMQGAAQTACAGFSRAQAIFDRLGTRVSGEHAANRDQVRAAVAKCRAAQ